MAIIGNTIRLNMCFVSFSGVKTDAENIKITVYGTSKAIIDTIQINNSHRISQGTYQYDYTIKDSNGDNKPMNAVYQSAYSTEIIIEIYGEVEGNPEVTRQKIKCTYI